MYICVRFEGCAAAASLKYLGLLETLPPLFLPPVMAHVVQVEVGLRCRPSWRRRSGGVIERLAWSVSTSFESQSRYGR